MLLNGTLYLTTFQWLFGRRWCLYQFNKMEQALKTEVTVSFYIHHFIWSLFQINRCRRSIYCILYILPVTKVYLVYLCLYHSNQFCFWCMKHYHQNILALSTLYCLLMENWKGNKQMITSLSSSGRYDFIIQSMHATDYLSR